MSRVIENLVKSVLKGIVRIIGFILGLVIKFSVGKRIFKLMLGEVVFVLLDVFGEFFIFVCFFENIMWEEVLGDVG